MKQSKLNQTPINLASTPFYILPDEFLKDLLAKQDRILEYIEGMKKPALNGYITEMQPEKCCAKSQPGFGK